VPNKPEPPKPDCYKCKHRRILPGDAHSRCAHPRVRTIKVVGNPRAIAKGWFIWPLNYDPGWLISCDGFEAKEAASAKQS
jgi:hypothetical protein